MYKRKKFLVFSTTGSQLSVKPQYLSYLSSIRQVSASVRLKLFIYSLVGLRLIFCMYIRNPIFYATRLHSCRLTNLH